MEDFIQFEVETMQRLNPNRNILREYLERYDFKVILVYLFKHETEKTSNIMKIVTDEANV